MSALDRTIRVFISSTFRDMHAERDVLNRVVFPELRKRCQQRGAEFIGVDLRWGVTEEEAQGAGALAVCLDEIERCRPFFVCLLGDRFGWVPPPEEVPASIFEAARASEAMPPLIVQSYQRDETVEPAVYRLRRDAGRRMSAEEADTLARFWEARGLEGAGDSITAREILRGVFEADYPPTHALFYLRASGVARDPAFPSSFVPVFVELDEARLQKLDALKARIRDARDRIVVHDYLARYAGLTIDAALLPDDLSPDDRAALDDGVVTPDEWPRVSAHLRQAIERHGTVALTEMDALAERVLDDLWKAIEPELERPATLDAHQRERAYHDRFVTRHTEFFRGRDAERARVVTYVADTEDREVLVVTAEPGSGKSAFMAECVRTCRALHPEALIIPHFIGAAPDSASLPATLRSLCETLRREVGLDEAVAEDPDKLRFQLRTFLEQAGTRRPVMLFLDALNQLDASGRSHELDWLPVSVPPGTRIIVSTLAGDCFDQLIRRVPLDHVVTIPALPVDERRALATEFLGRRRKKLTPDQLNELLDVEKRPDAGLPLYTLVALEELCLFGDHAALRARIESLPPTLPELFAQVLARIEHDHTRVTVEAVCAWLAVARSGLLESEVLDLLGTSGSFPRIRWTRLYRALEPYLKPIEEDAGARTGGRLDFYHDQLRSAAYRRYLHMAAPHADATDRCRESHRHLAEYFRSVAYDPTLPTTWRSDRVRSLGELPFHQTRGEMWEGLDATLSDLDFIAAKCAASLTYDLVRDYDAALAALPEGREERERERESDERVARYTRDLIEYARSWSDARDRHARDPAGCRLPEPGEIRLPVPPPTVRIWTEQEIEADTWRIRTMPTQMDRICSFRQFVREESSRLSAFGAQPGFCLQEAYNLAVSGPVGSAAEALLSSRATKDNPLALLRVPAQRRAWSIHPVCEQVLTGHTGSVNGVAVSLNRSRAVSASRDMTLRMWDLVTGECDHVLSGLTGGLESFMGGFRAVSVTADGRRVVSAGAGLGERRLTEPSIGFETLSGTPDEDSDLTGNWDATVQVWETTTGRCERLLKAHPGVATGVSVTPDGRLAVTGGADATVRIWDVATGACRHTLTGHAREVMAVAVTPDGRLVASASADTTVRLWNSATGMCECVLAVPQVPLEGRGRNGAQRVGPVLAVAITPDGRRVVSASGDLTLLGWRSEDTAVRVWDVTTGECERVFHGHTGTVKAVAVTPDGRRAVSGSTDSTLRVWDMVAGACERVLDGHSGSVNAVAVTVDGRYAVSGGDDQTVRVWNLSTGASEHTPKELTFGRAVTVTPDGRRAVTGDVNVRVWDIATGVCERTLTGHTLLIEAVAVTTDQQRAVTGSFDGSVRVWNLATGLCEHVLIGRRAEADAHAHVSKRERKSAHAGVVFAVAVTPDGRRVVSGAEDGMLRVWDLATGKCERGLIGHSGPVRALTLTPDGRRAISGGDDSTLRTWNLVTGVCERAFRGHTSSVVGVAVTVDGQLAVSASLDRTLRVWDMATGACVRMLDGHTGGVRAVAATPDGRCAVSVSDDMTLRAWDLGTAKMIAIEASEAFSCSVALSVRNLVYGEGRVLTPTRPLLLGPTLLTPTRLWRFSDGLHVGRKRRPDSVHGHVGQPSGHWDEYLTIACPWCGHSFQVDPPDPTSDGADIQCSAPDCGEPLRLTPFVCDPRDSGWG